MLGIGTFRLLSLLGVTVLFVGCGGGGPIENPPDGGKNSGAPLIKSIAPLTWPARNEAQFSAVIEGATPMSLKWSFGEAASPSTSTDAAPLVTWNEVGDYDVSLEAANSLGSDSYTYTMHSIGYVVSGRVVTYGEEGIEGVSVFFDNGLEPVVTSAGGYWWRDDLASGKYTITPGRVDWAFDPPSRTVTIENSEINGLWFTFTGCKRTEEKWLRTWSSSVAGNAVGVCTDSGGNVYVAGSGVAILKYDAIGDVQWARTWTVEHDWEAEYFDSAQAIAQDSAGNLYLTGRYNDDDDYNYDCFVAKVSPNGDLLWYKSTPDFASETIAVAGNVLYLGGEWLDPDSSDSPLAILKLTLSGTFLNCTTWQNSNSDYFKDLAVDAHGNVVFVGYSSYLGLGDSAAITVSLDGENHLNWARIWEGLAQNRAGDVAVDREGNILLSVVSAPEGGNRTELVTFLGLAPTGSQQWHHAWPLNDYYWSNIGSAVAWGIDGQAILGWQMSPAPGSGLDRYGIYTCSAQGELGSLISLTHPDSISVDYMAAGSTGAVALSGFASSSSAYWETTAIEPAEVDGIWTNIEITLQPRTIEFVPVSVIQADIAGTEDKGYEGYPESGSQTIMTAKYTPEA